MKFDTRMRVKEGWLALKYNNQSISIIGYASSGNSPLGITKTEWKKLKINEEIDSKINLEYAMLSLKHLEEKNYRYAYLDANTYLEMSVSNYLKHNKFGKLIPEYTDELFNQGKLKTLVILISIALKADYKITQSVLKSIEIRNDIIHKGTKLETSKDYFEHQNRIEHVVNFIYRMEGYERNRGLFGGNSTRSLSE